MDHTFQQYRRMWSRIRPPSEAAKSSPAFLWPDRIQSSFPYSPARSPRLPEGCSFQVCASAYLNVAAYTSDSFNRRQRSKLRSKQSFVLFVFFCSTCFLSTINYQLFFSLRFERSHID